MKTIADFLTYHSAQALRPFSESTTDRGLKLLFSVGRTQDSVDFSFVLSGRVAAELSKLAIPPLAEPSARRRRDELWKNTCLEIFIGIPNSNSYLEINLSPSGDWNAYYFDSYRSGMRLVDDAHPPLLKFDREQMGDTLTWHGSLRSANLSSDSRGDVSRLLGSGGLVMGASCVLEYTTGEHEYWALVHAGEKPDFHLRESFRLPL
jgi:hypothetical protein